MNDESYYRKLPGVPTRTGAGGAVARLDAGTGGVLIALIRPPDQDEWVLPKGGVDGDESLEDAARREIEEEAGFTRMRCLGGIGAAERLNGRKVWWQKTHYFLFLT